MQYRHSIKACAAAAALAAALAFAPSAAHAKDGLTFADAFATSPALGSGAELAGASYTAPAVLAQAAPQLPPPTAGLPDPRPEWPGGPAASAMPPAAASAPQLDPRARDAWLGECRRRMNYYYDDGGHRRRHHDADRGGEVGYDYCETYLDDYYRYHSQAGYGFAHPGHGQMMMAPRMMMAQAPRPMASQGPCEEVVTEEYVPEPNRTIRRPALRRAPARRVPDKRIRVY